MRPRVFSSIRTATRNFDRLPAIGDPSLPGVSLLLHARIAARDIVATAVRFIITLGLRPRSAGRPIRRQRPLWGIFLWIQQRLSNG